MMMTDKLGEQLSALVDGEFPEKKTAALLETLESDKELQRRWERYQLIGDAIRHNLPAYVGPDLASRVSEALHDEPPLLTPRPGVREISSALRPAAGFAIAASVATLAVFGLRSLTEGDGSPVTGLNQQASAVEASGTHWNLGQPAVESKLNRYLVNHYEYAPTNGMKGMLPYVTVVGHDDRR